LGAERYLSRDMRPWEVRMVVLKAAPSRAGMSTRKTWWGFITIICSRERGPSVSIERAGS
jgi:hypothetical protein